MVSHEENRKEKLDVSYDLFGMGADVCQITHMYLRGEKLVYKKTFHK